MSISNEALQKLLREVETQAIAAQQQISLVRTQQASKQREMRMAQLTRTELSALPPDTNIFEGVGKMFVPVPSPLAVDGGDCLGQNRLPERLIGWLIDAHDRFVALPLSDMKGKLDSRIKDMESDVEGLGKRLHYLEVSQKNSKDQIDRMLQGGGASAS
ncbi:hypothetical protein DL767_002387 [Monosporascus sp. MG133]|nr:hypothetical protein DL767_002387 [Monosporascus sp. MG133]